MRESTAPMLGVQALALDVLNAQVGKRLRLPTQAYMALSDAKVLDAQAGAETFGSALLAALAGSTRSLARACWTSSWSSAWPSWSLTMKFADRRCN